MSATTDDATLHLMLEAQSLTQEAIANQTKLLAHHTEQLDEVIELLTAGEESSPLEKLLAELTASVKGQTKAIDLLRLSVDRLLMR